MRLPHQLTRLMLGAAATLFSSTALAFPTDLEVRPLYGASSCDSALFGAELKVINTSDSPTFASSVFPEFAFNAGADEIEAVYPQVYAVIYDAAGNFVSWTGATIERSPWTFTSEYASDRKVSDVWRARFDPPSAFAANTIPPHGFLTVAVALRRAGGATPFDQDCDDFSKVSVSDGSAFHDDAFFHLIFTSTQQLVCEDLGNGTNDAESGIAFTEPFTSACR
jgi:hypothetical protein